MNFVNIGTLMYENTLGAKNRFNGEQVFAVGVKNMSCSIESLCSVFPQIKVVQRFPETVNSKYCNRDYISNAHSHHTLQPVLLSWDDSVQAPKGRPLEDLEEEIDDNWDELDYDENEEN